MIVNRMIQLFKVSVDKTDSLNSPDFLAEEIDSYLSDAQEEFIEQRAYGINSKNEFLEETQKRVKDLQSLTRNANINTFLNNTNNKPNGTFVQLPIDYRHSIQEEIQVTYSDCNQQVKQARVPVIALTHDKYNKVIQNPFTQPSLLKAYRLPFGRIQGREYFEIIIAPDQTLDTFILRYIKNPEKINSAQIIIPPATIPFGLSANQEGELTDESYREIIALAARNAMGDIQSPGTQEKLERYQREIE